MRLTEERLVNPSQHENDGMYRRRGLMAASERGNGISVRPRRHVEKEAGAPVEAKYETLGGGSVCTSYEYSIAVCVCLVMNTMEVVGMVESV